MALELYRRKRKFNVTPEPRGRKVRGKGRRFVIQKHAATRLHYDLRLELDGVMKSWAVTRGPSLVPGEKRLAVEVEDHPVEYNAFEGTIPKGEYGGGTVLVWDRGTWTPEQDPHRGLTKGHLEFSLQGEKLRGRWHLVRIRPRRGEKRTNWLLIKARDEGARSARDPDILEERPESVLSGRTIEEIAAGKGAARVWHSSRSAAENVAAGATRAVRRRGIGRSESDETQTASTRPRSMRRAAGGGAALPDFIPPSLATLQERPPTSGQWVHEIKFDGYRMQARLDHGKVKLLTRKGLDWTARFPNVAAAVARLKARTALIDGEVVVEDDDGISSFSLLQAALKEGARDRFRYYVFDLLHRDGEDLRGRPLLERKAALKRLLDDSGASNVIRYSEHFAEDGETVWRQACRMNLEGIVSKRANAPYRPGRTDAFLKTKCANAQELVVGGYVPSTAIPRAVGALAAGYYRDGQLVYAGRVGTGYTRAMARELWKRLHPLEADGPPFVEVPREARRGVRWVKPEMVIETEFRGWTADGLVRQAAFKGIRDDKPAREVVREMPTGALPRGDDGSEAGVGVRFTHPDRVYWPDVGVTKRDLADYYRSVWHLMAPHVVGRPLSFLRCPEGTEGECFFQKHASAGMSAAHLVTVADRKRRQVIAVDDLDGLLSLVQAGVLEVHLRGSRIDALDLCDRIVFDIDPGEGVPWSGVVAAAREVRERLSALRLESFVKLSGGKGLHVVLPVAPVEWDAVKAFTQAFAQAMAADDPGRYVARMTKSLRRGKIFIDYLRNSLEQTSVAAYSTRARAGAPVSAPVGWEELARTRSSNQFTVRNLGRRLAAMKRDPWADMTRVEQALPDFRRGR